MLMPRTWAFSPVNLARWASYAGIWSLQTGVKAIGKKASTTFCPRKLDKLTFLSRWLRSEKSGAGWPICSFIVFKLHVQYCVKYTLHRKGATSGLRLDGLWLSMYREISLERSSTYFQGCSSKLQNRSQPAFQFPSRRTIPTA